VEVFDIEKLKDLANVADTSLKKWKVSLFEYWEIKEVYTTKTDHPC
jgi:hypothetical protein